MYVYMYVCMCVYMCIYMCVHACVCIYFYNIFIGMLHYIMFVILHAFYIEYCRDYLSSVIFTINYVCMHIWGPPLWSSGQSFWLQKQRSRVRSPALPDFLSSGSGTGSTQPREVN